MLQITINRYGEPLETTDPSITSLDKALSDITILAEEEHGFSAINEKIVDIHMAPRDKIPRNIKKNDDIEGKCVLLQNLQGEKAVIYPMNIHGGTSYYLERYT